jgi:hypothetical protein
MGDPVTLFRARRRPAPALLIALPLALGACASSGEPADEAPLAEPAREPTPAAPDQPAAPDAAEAAAEPRAGATPDDPVREDGRPEWWFDGVRESGGAATLCAEALGVSMRQAKAAAVSAARRRLISAGARAERMDVEHVLVWPLPTASTSGARYAGYVLASAPIR